MKRGAVGLKKEGFASLEHRLLFYKDGPASKILLQKKRDVGFGASLYGLRRKRLVLCCGIIVLKSKGKILDSETVFVSVTVLYIAKPVRRAKA